jgi:streptogramin lyase
MVAKHIPWLISLGLLLAACGGQPPTAPLAAPTPTANSTPTLAPTATPPRAAPTAATTSAVISTPTLPPTATPSAATPTLEIKEYAVPAGSGPHDVAPAPDGSVWYTAQQSGQLGRLDPKTGETRHIPLGSGSHPHGVIVGPDGAPWITDGGLNAIVRVDPTTLEVQVFPLPAKSGNVNLNTATFDEKGVLWFTGQNGVYGRLNPSTRAVDVFTAPRGRGPYGIATTPRGEVYYASLAGSQALPP